MVLWVVVMMSSCALPVQNQTPDLENTSWQVVQIGDLTPPANIRSTVYFEKEGVNGSGGCNSYFGSYTRNSEKITFSGLGSTMMYCEEAMDQETAFLNALQSAARYRVEDGKLTLLDASDQTLMILAPIQHAELSGPTWKLSALNNGQQAVSSLPEGAEITAQFKDGRVEGSAGCNKYFATYEVEGDRLMVTNPGSSKMFCGEPEGVMEQEALFLQALPLAARFEIREQSLTIYGETGETLLQFTAQ
jgi:heat shock protein HslJ